MSAKNFQLYFLWLPALLSAEKGPWAEYLAASYLPAAEKTSSYTHVNRQLVRRSSSVTVPAPIAIVEWSYQPREYGLRCEETVGRGRVRQ